MTFTSIAFIFFLPIVVAAFYICPVRFRWALLLAASAYFYMAFVPKYILILFALIAVDYVLGILIQQESNAHLRRVYLLTGIVFDLGLLFFFKYFNFFNQNIALLAHVLHWNYSLNVLTVLLPLGLSFHIFQSLSYLIEVYRRKYTAVRHLGVFALYVMFFPQLVAGPIERPQHLLEQLKHLDVRFNSPTMWSGLQLVAWGFFKKMVIADRLALLVDYVYGHVAGVPGPSILVATLFFTIQLYTDFSGYSDIARGSARLLGIDIIRNFDQPFFSRSIAEFWRRWHVSLSSWFRDYVYYPLAWRASQWGTWWLYASIVITFVLTGIWHGAGWTFLLMGLLFGGYIVIGTLTTPSRKFFARVVGINRFPRLQHAWQAGVVFILTSIAFIFFRAPTIAVAGSFIRQSLVGWQFSASSLSDFYHAPFQYIGIGQSDFILSLVLIGVLFCVEYKQTKEPFSHWFGTLPLFWRSMLYASGVLAFVLFGIFTSHTFIYFQF